MTRPRPLNSGPGNTWPDPQLQQSIRMLQLSTLALEAEISQALDENPLLERDEEPAADGVDPQSRGIGA